MRFRAGGCAAAAVVGTAVARWLDATGRLPGVHETQAVRAVGPAATAAVLTVAALLGHAVARTRRPVPVAVACALVVAALPEAMARGDLGGAFEPGALAGAALQAVLVLLVVAVAVLADRAVRCTGAAVAPVVAWDVPADGARSSRRRRVVARRGRAPPPPSMAHHPSTRKGRHDDVSAVPRARGRSCGAAADSSAVGVR